MGPINVFSFKRFLHKQVSTRHLQLMLVLGLFSGQSLASGTTSNPVSMTTSSTATGSAAPSSSSSSSSLSASSLNALSSLASSLYQASSPAAGTLSAATNPYPIRTMIGNVYFRLMQHRKQLMIIPPLVRVLYQYRRPIVSAFQSFAGSAGSSLATKGAAGLGALAADTASSQTSAASGGLAAGASSNIPFYAPPPPMYGSASAGLLPHLMSPSNSYPAHPSLNFPAYSG